MRRFTRRPISSIARRISRFLPSRIATVIQAFAPCWRSSVTVIGWKRLAVDGQAAAQGLERRIVGPAVDAHPVAAQPAGRGQFQPALERAVIGQQEQAFGIEVEPSDADDAGHVGGQIVVDRRAPLLVARGGHPAGGFVIKPEPRGFGRVEHAAIHRDLVRWCHVERGAGDLLPVDGDAPGLDQALGLAAAGDAGAGDDLGDTLAGRGGAAHGCGDSAKPALAKAPIGGQKRAMSFRSHMTEALAEARAAAARGEVPVGAVVVDASGRVVARAGNRTRELSDPTAHAEILAIRAPVRRSGRSGCRGMTFT